MCSITPLGADSDQLACDADCDLLGSDSADGQTNGGMDTVGSLFGNTRRPQLLINSRRLCRRPDDTHIGELAA